MNFMTKNRKRGCCLLNPRFLGSLSAFILANCGVSGARAEVLVFDLENQVAAPKSRDEGRLSFLSLSQNGFVIEITRPGSVFDLSPQFGGDWQRPDSWGEISLSSFYDSHSATPININFSAPVSSFSLWMGDFAQDTDTLELEAFSLPDGKGQSLGRAKRTLQDEGGDKFSFEELTVRAARIRSVRFIAGSPVARHSMYYDHFQVDTSPAPSGE